MRATALFIVATLLSFVNTGASADDAGVYPYYLAVAADVETGVHMWKEVSSSIQEAERRAWNKCTDPVRAYPGECRIFSLPLYSVKYWEEWDVRFILCPSFSDRLYRLVAKDLAPGALRVAMMGPMEDPDPENNCWVYLPEVGGQSLGDWLAGEPIVHEED